MRVLPGGDYGFMWNPHGANARDLQYFVELLGFTPMEAIVGATKWGGEIMGRPDELGQVREGYLADLLLVDGDPLGRSAIARGSRPVARGDEGRRVPQRPAYNPATR